jgi:hypothetical protein
MAALNKAVLIKGFTLVFWHHRIRHQMNSASNDMIFIAVRFISNYTHRRLFGLTASYLALRKYNPKHFKCRVRLFKSCFAFVLLLECKTADCQRLLLSAILCGAALQLDSFFAVVWPTRKVETRGQAGGGKKPEMSESNGGWKPI